MALDDRERNFEKALRRQLRANAGVGLDCPDAETLAAYHERMLLTEEMASLKSHIAACPSCQEVLATLEVTEAIPAGEKDSENAFAGKARAAFSVLHAAPVFSKAPEMPVPAQASRVRGMPKPYMKWVAPAGAIAAGVLIWVAMNEGWMPQRVANQKTVQVAENRELKQPAPATPNPDQRATVSAAKPAEKILPADNELPAQSVQLADADKETKSPGRKGANSARVPSHGPAMMQNQVQNNANTDQSVNGRAFHSLSQLTPGVAGARSDSATRAEAKSQHAAAAPAPAPPPPAATGAAAGTGLEGERKDEKSRALAQTVEVQAAAPVVEGDKKLDSTSAPGAAGDLAVSGRDMSQLQAAPGSDANTRKQKENKAAEAGRMQLKKAEAAPVAGEMASASLRDVDEFRLSVVRTPDAKVFWVISRQGEVFRSEDGGKSSRKQEIGPGIKAIAGSSKDKKVCWILAEKEIVARTTDGGRHWTTANVPTGLPFTTITALDATHAIVSDASGRISYSTSDGGATWNGMMH
jgi:Photosynthesis system II assembly factor YCF48